MHKTSSARRLRRSPATKPLDRETEELVGRIRDALADRDGGRALYLLAKELGGEPLAEELAICNPDTGQPLAFLLPPGERHALMTAEDFRALSEDAHTSRVPAKSGGWQR